MLLKKKDDLLKTKKNANARYCDEYYSTSPDNDKQKIQFSNLERDVTNFNKDNNNKMLKSTSSERSDNNLDRDREFNELDDELGQKKYNDAQIVQAAN